MSTGKGKNGNRKSMIVNVIDPDKLNAAVRRVIAAQHGMSDDETSEYTAEPLVMIRNPKRDNYGFDRDVCVVGTEGVGWETNRSGLVSVPVRAGISTTYVDLSSTVIARCESTETVDFADWVRVFGDRLETNHDLWQHIGTVGQEYEYAS